MSKYRFIAFSQITGQSVAHGPSLDVAKCRAMAAVNDERFIEVLDCGDSGSKVWTGGVNPENPVPLHKARQRNRVAFCGNGYL